MPPCCLTGFPGFNAFTQLEQHPSGFMAGMMCPVQLEQHPVVSREGFGKLVMYRVYRVF
jgi:hypothetical protein